MCFSVLNVGAFACQGALGKQSEWLTAQKSIVSPSWKPDSRVKVWAGLIPHKAVYNLWQPLGVYHNLYCPWLGVALSNPCLCLHTTFSLWDDCAQIPLFLRGYQPCWIRVPPTPVGPHLNSLTLLKTLQAFSDAMTEFLTYISLWLALSSCFVSCFVLKQSPRS